VPPLPETKEGLEAAGWVFDNEGVCRACGAPLEWWVSATGKKAPMRVFALDAEGQVIQPGDLRRPVSLVRRNHFADCPNAEDFRKRKK
jgi:hypothetical protein